MLTPKASYIPVAVVAPGMIDESKQQSKNRVLCDNYNFHHRTHVLCVERSGNYSARTNEFSRWWSEVTSTISPQHPHHSACDGLRISIPKETFVLPPAAVDIATHYVARESCESQTHVDVKKLSEKPETSRDARKKKRLPPKSKPTCPQTLLHCVDEAERAAVAPNRASHSAETTQTA